MQSLIDRQILPEARKALGQFRALCITGPRQSGKTTLSKQLFKGKAFVNFENPSTQFEADQNPDRFLKRYLSGAKYHHFNLRPPFNVIPGDSA